MSNIPLFEDNAFQTRDLLQEDGKTLIWPVPHDAKLDVQRLLRTGLDAFGLTDVVVSKSGAFTQAQLENEDEASVPYITVLRTGDVQEPVGLGDLVAFMGKGDPKLVDQGLVNTEDDLANGIPSVPDGGTAVFHGWQSVVNLTVTISDKNSFRADQMYIIIKLMMLAAKEEFRRIGYIRYIRTGGEDSQDLTINGSSPLVIYNRSLHFQFVHHDYVATIEAAVNLVKQTLNFNEADASNSITTDL
jgi:hypothetical protein